jgi:hypothetical protein
VALVAQRISLSDLEPSLDLHIISKGQVEAISEDEV